MGFVSKLREVFGRAAAPAAAPAGHRRQQLTVSETESNFTVGARSWSGNDRERYDYDREEILRQALDAWRSNPVARRIVELTTQYVVGGGIRLRVDHLYTHKFMVEFWEHQLNQMGMRIYEWCDELTRSGEIFVLVSTDAAGMSYVRAVPALNIEEIVCAENDLQQEQAYVQKATEPGEEPRVWPAYNQSTDGPEQDGSFPAVMLHYAINRPVGAVRGESDLAPVLRWLSRYANWLEDRARLNRYRNAFLFVIKGAWQSEEERLARQNALSVAPPTPGSFLVTDNTETWEVLSPKLESHEAGEDGLAIKKMIATGAGLPLHFLAEPEGSNRSTAESAGGPTYRHFEQRQEFFTWVVSDLARVVIRRRGCMDGRIKDDAGLQVTGADLSARDNAALAVAMSTATNSLGALRDRAIIDDAEYLRLVYRFAGESVDVEAVLARGRRAGANPPGSGMNPADHPGGEAAGGAGPAPAAIPGKPAGVKVDKEDGELKGMPGEEV